VVSAALAKFKDIAMGDARRSARWCRSNTGPIKAGPKRHIDTSGPYGRAASIGSGVSETIDFGAELQAPSLID